MACRQNRTGSLSPASSDSQATGWPPDRAQSASRTVLPNPAGADTKTTPAATPSPSRPTNRGRDTNPGCGRGTCSLVASTTSRSEAATQQEPPSAPQPSATQNQRVQRWLSSLVILAAG